MELRYRMAVVTGGGHEVGRAVALALGRRGMSVLVADRDMADVEETVALVRACRVAAWPLQADLTDAGDVRLLAGRARDLGGADVLVHDLAGASAALATELFLAGSAERRTPDAPAACVGVDGCVGTNAPRAREIAAAVVRLLDDVRSEGVFHGRVP